jgi:hypothetical protein
LKGEPVALSEIEHKLVRRFRLPGTQGLGGMALAGNRNRSGNKEEQFFARVFPGSGFLFVASLFASAALPGALIQTLAETAPV